MSLTDNSIFEKYKILFCNLFSKSRTIQKKNPSVNDSFCFLCRVAINLFLAVYCWNGIKDIPQII